MFEPQRKKLSFPIVYWLLLTILCIHVALLSVGVVRNSPTYDEIQHVPAGIMHRSEGRFDFGYTNPPLARVIATLPIDASTIPDDWLDFDAAPHGHWTIGKMFAQSSNGAYPAIVRQARWCSLPFSLLVAVMIFRWSTKLYQSPWCGLTATALWCFCPFALGHGCLATVDVAAAALGLLAAYQLWQWTLRPTFLNAALVGTSLALACLTKFSWLLLCPVALGTWGYLLIRYKQKVPIFGQAITLAALFLIVINLGYMGDGSLAMVASYQAEGRLTSIPPLNGLTGGLPVPLPRYFVLGLDALREFTAERPTGYFCGEWFQGGWYGFYGVGLLLKLTCGTLGVLAMALCCNLRRSPAWFPLLLAVVFLSVLNLETSVAQHVRYTIPCLPLLFVWAGGVALVRGKLASSLLLACLTAQVVSSLWIFPHSLSFFNTLAGGPVRGPSWLLDSNVDWGQDIGHLARWQQDNQVADQDIEYVIFGTCDPNWLGLPGRKLPAEETPPKRYLAISVNFLFGMEHRAYTNDGIEKTSGDTFEHLREQSPAARTGYSVYIFDTSQVPSAHRP